MNDHIPWSRKRLLRPHSDLKLYVPQKKKKTPWLNRFQFSKLSEILFSTTCDLTHLFDRSLHSFIRSTHKIQSHCIEHLLFSFLGLSFFICKMRWLDFIRSYLKFFSSIGIGSKLAWIVGKNLLVGFKSHLFISVSSSEPLQ